MHPFAIGPRSYSRFDAEGRQAGDRCCRVVPQLGGRRSCARGHKRWPPSFSPIDEPPLPESTAAPSPHMAVLRGALCESCRPTGRCSFVRGRHCKQHGVAVVRGNSPGCSQRQKTPIAGATDASCQCSSGERSRDSKRWSLLQPQTVMPEANLGGDSAAELCSSRFSRGAFLKALLSSQGG